MDDSNIVRIRSREEAEENLTNSNREQEASRCVSLKCGYVGQCVCSAPLGTAQSTSRVCVCVCDEKFHNSGNKQVGISTRSRVGAR